VTHSGNQQTSTGHCAIVPWHRHPLRRTQAPPSKKMKIKNSRSYLITLDVFVTTLFRTRQRRSLQCTTYHYSQNNHFVSRPTLKSTTACKCSVVYTFYDFRDFVDSFAFIAMNIWPWCIINSLTLTQNVVLIELLFYVY